MPKRPRLTITVTAAIGTLAGAASLAGAAGFADREIATSGAAMKSKGRMAAREDKRQTVALASGARVRIKSIAGAVSVQPSNSGKAEIHVARLAASQRELGCYRVDVDASPQRIDIVTVQLKDRPGCAMIEARQQVTLKLPKAADVHLSSIAGPVDIGAMDGMVQLEGIAGQTSLASARSAKISGIAGPLSVRLQRPGPWSTDISGITGTVDLAFGNGIDADVNVSGLMGRVRTLSPDIRAVGGTHQHKVRVGSGGPVLSLSGIVGTVQVRRY